MMRNAHFFYVVCRIMLFVLLVGCSSKRSGNESKQGVNSPSVSESVSSLSANNEIPRVNIRKKFSSKGFILQECADIEYIPLETRPDVLLDGSSWKHYYVSDSLIINYNYDGTVFIFNRSGKIVNVFNHQGRGPEEYWELRAMTVDFARKEIYIFDYPLYYRIRVYTFDGVYKRTLGTPGGMPGGLYIYNYGDYLLCYDYTKNKDCPAAKMISPLNPQPYFLLNKITGNVLKLNIHLKNFVGDKIVNLVSKGVTRNVNIGFLPIYKNGAQVYISDAALDTIYQLNGTRAVPFMIKDPSVEDRNPSLLVWMTLKTNRYTFLQSSEKVFASGKGQFSSPMFTLYDHETGESFYSADNFFTNSDYLIEKSVRLQHKFDELPENYAKALLSPLELLEAYRAGHLQGRLKEIASHLREEDNPVLMLVKFKE